MGVFLSVSSSMFVCRVLSIFADVYTFASFYSDVGDVTGNHLPTIIVTTK